MTMEPDEVVQVLLRARVRIVAVAASIVRDMHAADDIFQQVVLAALEDRDHFRDTDHVVAWSLQVTRHRSLDLAHRRRLLCLPDEVLDLLESEWQDSSTTAWSDRMEALLRCVSRLAGPARELLQKKYMDGQTVAVIADELRRTPDAIYQSLSRIHRSLRRCVEREILRLSIPATDTARGAVPETNYGDSPRRRTSG